jgi:hypothetical protein
LNSLVTNATVSREHLGVTGDLDPSGGAWCDRRHHMAAEGDAQSWRSLNGTVLKSTSQSQATRRWRDTGVTGATGAANASLTP